MVSNQDWTKEKLEYVLDLIIDHRGITPKKLGGNWVKSGFPALSAKNIKNGKIINEGDIRFVNKAMYEKWMPEKLKAGDILLTSEAPLGEIFFINKETDYCLSQRLFALRAKKEKIDPRFLYYFLMSSAGQHQLKRRISGTAAEGIRQAELWQIEICYPEDIKEQKRIADILSAFDEKIELNNKINENLEKTAQAIFKEWFINNEKLKIKNEKIDNLAEIISGYPFSSKIYTNDKKALGVVTIKNVQDGIFITDCDSFVNEKNVSQKIDQECYLHDGDILLSLTGNVGRVCFVYGGEYLLNQRVAKIKPKNKKDHAFCYFLFRQPLIQNILINMAKGSAQPNLSPVETREIRLAMPSRELLDKFSEFVNPIFWCLIKNSSENKKLSSLRDLLLPKLMSGEIIV